MQLTLFCLTRCFLWLLVFVTLNTQVSYVGLANIQMFRLVTWWNFTFTSLHSLGFWETSRLQQHECILCRHIKIKSNQTLIQLLFFSYSRGNWNCDKLHCAIRSSDSLKYMPRVVFHSVLICKHRLFGKVPIRHLSVAHFTKLAGKHGRRMWYLIVSAEAECRALKQQHLPNFSL